MGTVHKFRLLTEHKVEFRGQPPKRLAPGKRRGRGGAWWLREKVLALAILGLAAPRLGQTGLDCWRQRTDLHLLEPGLFSTVTRSTVAALA